MGLGVSGALRMSLLKTVPIRAASRFATLAEKSKNCEAFFYQTSQHYFFN